MQVDAGRRWVIGLAAGLPLGLGAVLFVGTLQFQVLLSLSPLATGIAYTVLAVPVVAGSPLASALTNRLPVATVASLGFGLQAAGLALLAGSPALLPTWPAIVAGLVAVGFGAPIAYVPLTTVAIDDAAGDSGLASGVFNTVQQVANAVGLAVLAAVASAGATRAVGYAAAYATAAVTMAVIATLAVTVLAARLPVAGYPTGSRASPR
jgi:predicted MFS family arabinose efflux permease